VTGTAPLWYQWQSNNVAIASATNSSYTNLSVTLADAGSYVCLVSNSCGAITSAVAMVTISNTTPVVTVNGPNSLRLGRNQSFTDPGASALDACAGSLTPVETGSVITNVPGAYTLTYSATDPAGNTGTATLTVTVTDAPPVVANFAFGAVTGLPANVSIINGKYAPVSPYGDPLTVSNVSGETNGTVNFTTTNLTYTATNVTLDNLTYVVTDPYGTTASGQITMNIIANSGGYNQMSAAMPLAGNQVVLSYLGIPDSDYALEWAPNLTPPVVWTTQQTNTTAVDGTLNFTNSADLPQNFYRTQLVP